MPPKATKADALRGQRRFSVVEPHEWLVGSEIWVPSPNDEVLFDKGEPHQCEGFFSIMFFNAVVWKYHNNIESSEQKKYLSIMNHATAHVLIVIAHVKSIAGTDVICDVNGEQKKFSLRECRNVNARVDPLLVQDLSKLTHVNDAAVLDFLRVRYINDQIYVSLIEGGGTFDRIPIGQTSHDWSDPKFIHENLFVRRHMQPNY